MMGSGVLGRAFMEAYKQALQNGGKAAAGAAAAAGKAAVDPFAAEARAILNIKPKASAEEVREAAERLAAMNDPAKGGSEYLRAKIRNARDALLKEEAPPSRRRATTRTRRRSGWRAAEGVGARGARAASRRARTLHAATPRRHLDFIEFRL